MVKDIEDEDDREVLGLSPLKLGLVYQRRPLDITRKERSVPHRTKKGRSIRLIRILICGHCGQPIPKKEKPVREDVETNVSAIENEFLIEHSHESHHAEKGGEK